jgi:hypothetical protein
VATQIVSPYVHSAVPSAFEPAVKPHASVYEIVTSRILAELENGQVPWRKPWRTLPPANLISKKSYRGINVFLLAVRRVSLEITALDSRLEHLRHRDSNAVYGRARISLALG